MTEFRIDHIPATPMNGADIPAMVQDEIIQAQKSMRAKSTFAVLTPTEQVEALTSNPDNYWGAFDEDDRLMAYMKLGNWWRTNQLAYESLGASVKYKLGRVLHIGNTEPQLPGNPMGIFGLTAYAGLSKSDATEALTQLTEKAVETAGNREIKIGHYATWTLDPAHEATYRNGFVSTMKFGHVGGLLQELYIHTPSSEA